MLLLAFDTATPAVTVALYDRATATVMSESTTVDARRTGEILAPAIKDVLARADCQMTDLNGIAVGVGPGPFTGLRVGLVTARALGDALEIPVYGVCTLDILAFETNDSGMEGPFAVATDARRKEVYWAVYDDLLTRRGEADVARPAEIADQLTGLPVVGEGPHLYPDFFPKAGVPRYPSAAFLAELVARRLDTEGAEILPPEPLYLRRPDAVEPGARKPVSTG